MATRILELLQLADSAFPSGGFAFSSGLESLAKLGHLRSLEDFEEYLGCHLEQVTGCDLPFLTTSHATWDSEPEAEMEIVCLEWDAWLSLPTQRRASLAQGPAWLRAIEEAYPCDSVRAVRRWFQSAERPQHFLVALGASLKAADKSLEDAQALFMHMALRDQLSAAVRLGLLGSLQAQRLHRGFIAVAESLLVERGGWTCEDAVKTSPMIELAQASHPYLYSKLFQS